MKAPDFWYQDHPTWLACALRPLGALLYHINQRRFKHKKGYSGKTPLICIGNATVGGTGKTPIAIHIAQIFLQRGKKVVFLTRGYGGTIEKPTLVTEHHSFKETGDEAQLLSLYAPVVIAKDRVAGADYVDTLGADVIILDDGMQNHPSLHAGIVIMTVDGMRRFGNRCLLPAGPLREPISSAIDKANIVIVTSNRPVLLEELEQANCPVLTARREMIQHGADIERQRVIAFAGIGNPDQFFELLRTAGAKIVHTEAFPDHYIFDNRILDRLVKYATQEDAILVTTEKDMVRIDKHYYPYLTPIMTKLSFPFEDEEALVALLESVMV